MVQKLEEHLKEKGFETVYIRELLRNIDERNWPSPIESDSLRIKNKPVIETYSKSLKYFFYFFILSK